MGNKKKVNEIFNQFILQGLRLNPHDFCIIDLRQLPQTPITKNGVSINQTNHSLNVYSAFEKHVIQSSLTNLKEYN